MPKLVTTDLGSLVPQASAVASINSNFTAVEDAVENTLSRDGTSPNSMEADLDMDSNSIINLPVPLTNTEPVRKSEFDDLEDRIDDVEVSIGSIDAQLAAAIALVGEAEALVEAAEDLDDYYVVMWADGLISGSEQLLDHLFGTTVVFPANLTGSRSECRTASTASKVFSIQKNDVQFSTITFSIGADTGTFAASSETTFSAGDRLNIVGPAVTDATLAGVSISLLGAKD